MKFYKRDLRSSLEILDAIENLKWADANHFSKALIVSLVSTSCHIMTEEECLTLISDFWEIFRKNVQENRETASGQKDN